MICPHCESMKVEANGYCATFNRAARKELETAQKDQEKRDRAYTQSRNKFNPPIKKVSDQRSEENAVYRERRKVFIQGKMCPVFPNLPAQEIHHKAGRRGYIDEWAKENKISAFLDERYWIAVSRQGHKEIELNPEWAKVEGYSVSRLSNKDI